jgi:PAS domain S-box-containing protein
VERKDLLGRRVTEVFPGVTEFGFLESFRRVWLTGEPEHHTGTRYSDELRAESWREYSVHKLPGGQVVAIYDDITERKAAEDALRQTSDYLESLINYANAPIIVWDTGFKIQRFNDAFEKLTGYSSEEVIDRDLSILFPVETREESLGKIESTLSDEFWESVEIPILRKDGGTRVALWNSANIYGQHGKDIIATIAQGQDITGRKAAENALRQSEEAFRQLADNLPEVVFEADSAGRFVYVNSNALDAFGYTEEEMYSSDVNVLMMIAEEYREKVVSRMRLILTEGYQGSSEYIAQRKDGSTFPAIISTLPIIKGQTVVGLRGVLTDITAQKEVEEALQRLNKELEGYAHIVSHDLKSPLSVVSLAGEALYGILGCEGGETAGGRAGELLRIIKENTARAIRLINNLLALAEAGQSPATDKSVEVAEVVGSVLKEKEAALAGRRTCVSLDGDLGVVAMDPTHVYQLFANLVGNAINHVESEDPEIQIRNLGENSEGRLSYLVRDNGCGIPEQMHEKVFTPFVKGRGGGNGIGLAIADKVVRLYGGEIRVYNEGGACFEFDLPACPQ